MMKGGYDKIDTFGLSGGNDHSEKRKKKIPIQSEKHFIVEVDESGQGARKHFAQSRQVPL